MTDPLQTILAGLQREYLLDAPARLAELRKDLEAFRAGEADALPELILRLHRLAGSGGSYGFPRITELAREAEQWLATERPVPGEEVVRRLGEVMDLLAVAVDTSARDIGLATGAVPAAEFGWRALAVGPAGDLMAKVVETLTAAGFQVRTDSGAGEPREVRLSERPDLVVVLEEPDGPDAYAAATAWSGGGPVRPRSIVLVTDDLQPDRVRALAAGIDSVLAADRVSVDLASHAKTLARIGSPPPRVLLAESSAGQAEAIIQWLERSNAAVIHCRDGLAARDAIIREAPDIIVMDTRLPGMDGLSLARLVRQDARFGLIPIVFLTHHDTVADQIEALSAGADHFLAEPVDRELLTQLIINRAERGRRLREMVHRDGLTGLLNHATLMAELEHTVEFARRHGETFAFAMVDVDHFKRVNDRFGHLAGDQVLLHVARVFQTTARASDLIGRYGGEEFGLILRRTDRQGALVLARKLRSALVSQPAVVSGSGTVPVKICVGIACYPDDASTATDLARLADQALYRAKAGGRDRIEMAADLPQGGA